MTFYMTQSLDFFRTSNAFPFYLSARSASHLQSNQQSSSGHKNKICYRVKAGVEFP